MTVPITSDLAGYADFWARALIVLALSGAAFLLALILPVYVLLFAILRK